METPSLGIDNLSRRAFIGASAALLLDAAIGRDSSAPLIVEHAEPAFESRIVRFDDETYPGGPTYRLPESAFLADNVAQPLPHDIVQGLTSITNRLNQILTKENRISGFIFSKINPDPMGVGRKMYFNAFPLTKGKKMPFELYPNVEYSRSLFERTIFHESMHRLNKQGENPAAYTANPNITGAWISAHARGTYREFDGYESEKGNDPIDLRRAGLWALFDESSFAEMAPTDTNREMGHPYDSAEELMASTLTILRFFPKGFMASAETLPQEWRAKALQFARTALIESRANAADQDAFSRLFSREIKEYLDL